MISGAALAASLGLDRSTVWQAVAQGRCGVGPLTEMEALTSATLDGGQAAPLPKDDEVHLPREVRYLRKVLRDALLDSGLTQVIDGPQAAGLRFNFPYPANRCGIALGTTLHGMRSGGAFLRDGDFQPLRGFLATAVVRSASQGFGLEGPALTTCSACSSSLGAVALAMTLLQTGQLDLVAAGGYDPISEYAYAGFNSLRLVSPGPQRPFARDRQGMKVGEGYGIVILERAADLHRRGRSDCLAQVLSFGESADAHHLTQPHPQGDGAARAIQAALDAAHLTPDQIDLIAAHGTATPDNDAGEYAALRRIWGENLPRVPVVAFKSHLSHTLGGAGVIELILSAMALRNQTVPPCANVGPDDSDFEGLNLATGLARQAALRTSINISLGFGGANTCVILGDSRAGDPVGSALRTAVGEMPKMVRSADPTQIAELNLSERENTHQRNLRDVFITGIGVVLPNAVGNTAWRSRLEYSSDRINSDAPSIDESLFLHLLNARRARRISGYVKLSLAAAMLAFQDAGVTDVPGFCESASAVLGSTHGSSQYCRDYYGQIVRQGISAANPLLFAEGVPNAAAAHLSLAAGIKGACQTIIGSRTAGIDALGLASARIASGQWDRAIVGAAEEYCDVVNAAYAHCGLHAPNNAALPFAHDKEGNEGGASKTFAIGCGAVALVLESRASVEARAARVRGSVGEYAAASPPEGRNIQSADQILAQLGDPCFVISSANGTWLDRVEAAALRLSGRRSGQFPNVSSLAGHMAECFSVTPLASIAAVLLTGNLPRLWGPGLKRSNRDSQDNGSVDVPIDDFAALSSDYAGLIAGIRVRLNRKSLVN